ncbi:paraquat-inducible protein A [Pistricoccus aurantiacus]|uniref:Paraquat-inducible protein A n=1 Tax=Pistricoccus aurantiacus TaxID=1883414 RepID=A0A5B8SXR4_9GAMM|nr:paraquat-inducible protein A [Pistricoccus aurantiacus]QEA40927.1 paraquat-inducible protein A [Pistricoccus aurantiacus]
MASPETRSTRRRLRACHECDWLVALPPLNAGEKADCPRCDHTLVTRHHWPAQRSMALAVSALIALTIAIIFPFVSFDFQGFGDRIELPQTATSLLGFHQPLIAIAVALFVMVLPGVYLLGVIWLHIGLLRGESMAFSCGIARSLAHMNPWMMADVFIIGTLVSLIKMAGLAEIDLDLGFWAFCAFTILLLLTTQSIDADWMWFSLTGEPQAPENCRIGQPAAPQGLAGCPTCGLVNRLDDKGQGHCLRCGEPLHLRYHKSLQRTWALLIAAAIMYIPANVYPIMNTTWLGHTTPSTIITGVVELWESGSYPVAIVILFASITVPVLKLIALSWLCYIAPRSRNMHALGRTRLHRMADVIGRWSMVDIFVVAILGALVNAGNLMTVSPGSAILPFASVVILTMLAAKSFDSRLLWDNPSDIAEFQQISLGTKDTTDA